MDTRTQAVEKSISAQFGVVGIDASDDGIVKKVPLEFIDTHNYWSILVVKELFKAMQNGTPYVTLSVKVQTCEEPQK